MTLTKPTTKHKKNCGNVIAAKCNISCSKASVSASNRKADAAPINHHNDGLCCFKQSITLDRQDRFSRIKPMLAITNVEKLIAHVASVASPCYMEATKTSSANSSSFYYGTMRAKILL